jgi:hypothetical protein
VLPQNKVESQHSAPSPALSVDENKNSVLLKKITGIQEHRDLVTEEERGSIGHWHPRSMIQSNSARSMIQSNSARSMIQSNSEGYQL